MPNLALQPAVVPSDAPYSQALMNFIASYLRLSGLENLTGILVSITAPAATDRDKAWLKLDPATNRALGFFVYRGDWVQIPVIVPNGESEPAGPRAGELFFNTKIAALKLYDGSEWTTNFFHTGDTDSRPDGVPVNYLYFDTTIGRLLRHAAQGWTTLDGAVGDLKMVDFATAEAATEANPGWSVCVAMQGRFPLGASDDQVPQAEGGAALADLNLVVATTGSAAQRGNQEQPFVSTLSINGVAGASGANSGATTNKSTTVDLTPPYKALIFLRKDF